MKLNWRGDETRAEARCSHEIGGRFRIECSGGGVYYGHRPPIVFEVRWYEPGDSGNTPWIGVGETMEEAKALAQQAHDQARSAIARILDDAKAIARETLKKAPRATGEYRQRQATNIEQIREVIHNAQSEPREPLARTDQHRNQ
jgi:hypothetical protein